MKILNTKTKIGTIFINIQIFITRYNPRLVEKLLNFLSKKYWKIQKYWSIIHLASDSIKYKTRYIFIMTKENAKNFHNTFFTGYCKKDINKNLNNILEKSIKDQKEKYDAIADEYLDIDKLMKE